MPSAISSPRLASFKRSRFSLLELELWRKRSGVKRVFSVTYTAERCRVSYV